MTDEEKALEYADKNIDIAIAMYNPNAMRHIQQAYLDGLTKGREEGYEQGMKKVCEICEQHILKEHPNAYGCAFKRLGNEYCWESKK